MSRPDRPGHITVRSARKQREVPRSQPQVSDAAVSISQGGGTAGTNQPGPNRARPARAAEIRKKTTDIRNACTAGERPFIELASSAKALVASVTSCRTACCSAVSAIPPESVLGRLFDVSPRFLEVDPIALCTSYSDMPSINPSPIIAQPAITQIIATRSINHTVGQSIVLLEPLWALV